MHTRYKNNIKQCTQGMKTIENNALKIWKQYKTNNALKIWKQYKTMHSRYENNIKQCTQDIKTI